MILREGFTAKSYAHQKSPGSDSPQIKVIRTQQNDAISPWGDQDQVDQLRGEYPKAINKEDKKSNRIDNKQRVRKNLGINSEQNRIRHQRYQSMNTSPDKYNFVSQKKVKDFANCLRTPPAQRNLPLNKVPFNCKHLKTQQRDNLKLTFQRKKSKPKGKKLHNIIGQTIVLDTIHSKHLHKERKSDLQKFNLENAQPRLANKQLNCKLSQAMQKVFQNSSTQPRTRWREMQEQYIAIVTRMKLT